MTPVTLDQVKVETRQPLGSVWMQIRGTVNGQYVSCDIPRSRLHGLTEAQEEDQMKRALRAAHTYARPT